ncbi:MAG: OmpA family protein [Candidatus Methylacidiphilales bacterium]
MKNTSLLITLLLASNFLFAQNSSLSIINFENNSFQLAEKNSYKLDSLIKEIKANNNIKGVDIIGYTDNKGNYLSNHNLSKNRAESVLKYLVKAGIDNKLLLAKYLGSKAPVSKNDNEVGMAKNRRVEIIIHYKKEISENLSKTNHHNTFQCINYKNLDKQQFKFKQNNEIKIVGKEGTKIIFSAASFVDSMGNLITEELEFTLYEVYKISDMLLSNLQTMSNDNLLETSGMFSINAFSRGKKAYLKSGMNYQFEIPTKNSDKNVKVFYGDTSKRNINWIQDTLNIKPQPQLDDLTVNLFGRDSTMYDYSDRIDYRIYNQFKGANLGWINCDRFVNVKNKTNLKVNIKDSTIKLFLVFTKINSVMYASYFDRTVFSNLPVGYQVTLLGILETNEGYVFGKKNFTIEKNMEVDLTIDNYSKEEFDSFISKLNQ